MHISKTLIVITCGILLGAPVWAGGRNQADQLPIAPTDQRVAHAHGANPADAQAAQQQRQQVQRLLDQLEAGKNVDPAEVERVLRQSLQND